MGYTGVEILACAAVMCVKEGGKLTTIEVDGVVVAKEGLFVAEAKQSPIEAGKALRQLANRVECARSYADVMIFETTDSKQSFAAQISPALREQIVLASKRAVNGVFFTQTELPAAVETCANAQPKVTYMCNNGECYKPALMTPLPTITDTLV